MTRAFIVKIELDDPDVNAIADDIWEILTQEGYDVVDVNPWDSPNEDQLHFPFYYDLPEN